jgi:hypothetical protein
MLGIHVPLLHKNESIQTDERGQRHAVQREAVPGGDVNVAGAIGSWPPLPIDTPPAPAYVSSPFSLGPAVKTPVSASVVAPTEILSVAGVTAIVVSVFVGPVAAVTLNAAVPLTSLSEAVMVREPGVAPVDKPDALIDATAAIEAVQVAIDVTFAVDPSL